MKGGHLNEELRGCGEEEEEDLEDSGKDSGIREKDLGIRV